MRTKRRLSVLLAAVTALALAAGCGSAGEESGGGTRNGKRNSKDTQGGLTVTDSRGQVSLEGPAKKVVALEWTYAEDLLAVGVEPVGVADIKGYHDWITAGPRLDDGVKEVGTRQQPSLETIRALEPDLIITSKHRAEANIDDLEKIAAAHAQ